MEIIFFILTIIFFVAMVAMLTVSLRWIKDSCRADEKFLDRLEKGEVEIKFPETTPN